MKRLPIIVLLFVLPAISLSQVINVKDSVITGVVLKISYGFQFPEMDMKTRFGWNSGIGGEVVYKFKNNWQVGVHGQYLFGNNVKEWEKILEPLINTNGSIINIDGEGALISVEEEGYMVGVEFGKVWKFLQANSNSGVITTFGLGYMDHWIKYDVEENLVPQLEGDYIKLYDRKTSGIYLRQFIGYNFQSNTRLLNFYGGVEIVEGFTRGRRSYDLATGGPSTGSRFDMLIGIRIGWMLPFYPNKPDEFYFN